MTQQQQSYPGPTCPKRGKVAPRTDTRYGPRYDCCGMTAWDQKPLATRETLQARVAAHAAFDPLWQDGHISRNQAYKRLAAALGLSRGKAHMAVMDEATALKVPAVADAIRKELGLTPAACGPDADEDGPSTGPGFR